VVLPSFMVMSGLYARALWSGHDGLAGAVGGLVVAVTWPAAALAWLAWGAALCWLAWWRPDSRTRLVGLGVGAAPIALVLLTAPAFALVPDGAGQGFAPDVLSYCPGGPAGTSCPPEWLFSAPRLAGLTQGVAPWLAVLLVLATVAMAFLAWRRSSGGSASGTGAAARS